MSFTILQGDARHIPLRDGSVQCVVTSPPFYGLRDYGVAGQIGLESSLCLYLTEMVAVFKEIWRVLRKDGTVWCEIGDSYSGSWGNYSGQNRGNGTQRKIITGSQAVNPAYDGLESWRPPTSLPQEGLKPKNMMGVPWRLAFALQDAGWYLRQDIIWSRPNPMPESVQDRCTKSHSYIFLLTKSANYYYDAESVREKGVGRIDLGNMTSPARLNQGGPWTKTEKTTWGRNLRSIWTIATEPFTGTIFDFERADYVASHDRPYIASPDCLIHGHLANRRNQQTSAGDEQLSLHDLRSLDIDARHVQERIFSHASKFLNPSGPDCDAGSILLHIRSNTPANKNEMSPQTFVGYQDVSAQNFSHTNRTEELPMPSVDSLDLLPPQYAEIANPRNTQTHKKAHVPETSLSCTASAETFSRSADTQETPEKTDSAVHIGENSILLDSVSDETETNPSEQIVDYIVNKKSSYSHNKCICRISQQSHFATMPTEIVRRCVLAGTSEKGCCSKCGASVVRITETERHATRPNNQSKYSSLENDIRSSGPGNVKFGLATRIIAQTSTIGWAPSCSCNATIRPAVVFDPFAGAFTTCLVADRLGRHGIGLELSDPYCVLGKTRLTNEAPLFANLPVAPVQDIPQPALFGDTL